MVSRFATESNRMAKTELEEAGLDTENMVESTAKLREEIMALSGVDIMENDNTFKSTYQILDELAAKWQDLTDIQQASITELIAGKRQGNIISSLMSNFDIARNALETSLGSEGSATTELGKWQESIEAKLLKLKASWQSFAQTFMSSDFLKGGIDALTTLVDILESLIDNFGILGTIGLGAFGKGLFTHFKGAKEAKKNLNDVVNAIHELNDAKNASISTNQAEIVASEQAANAEMQEAMANEVSAQTENKEVVANTASAESEVAEASANATSTASELQEATASAVSAEAEIQEAAANEAVIATELEEVAANESSAASELKEASANTASSMAEAAETATNLTSATSEAAEGMANMAGAAGTAGSAISKATGGFKAFASTLSGKLMIIGAVVSVLNLLYNQYKKVKEEQAALRQETIEASDAFLDSASSFEQAYIKYSGKSELTAEEESELESAIQGTVDALDDKSSALQNVVNSSNNYIDSLERIKDAELEAAKRAATDKRDAAKKELEETAIGWTDFDGSEVNIVLSKSAAEIAKQIDSEFIQTTTKNVPRSTQAVEETSFFLSGDADIDEIIGYYDTLLEYQESLSDAYEDGLIDEDAYNATSGKVTAVIGKMSDAVTTYTTALYELEKAGYQIDNNIPKTIEDYLEMRKSILTSDNIKNKSFDTKLSIANELDAEYGKIFDLSSVKAQARQFVGLIKNYGNGTIDGTNEIGTVETFLNLRTSVNNDECTVKDYMSQFDKIEAMTDNWSEEEKELFNTSIGVDTDNIKSQYDEIYNYLSQKGKNVLDDTYSTNQAYLAEQDDLIEQQNGKIKEFLNGLTASELSAAISLKGEIDWENGSKEKILKQIEEEARLNEAIAFTVDLEVETEKLENLATAISESVSGAGLGNESISLVEDMFGDLDSYDPSKLFERTTNGIRLNADELRKLNDEYKKTNIDGLENKMSALGDRYNQTREELSNLTYGTDEYKQKAGELDDIESQIKALEQLGAQYEGLASAYQTWQIAESSGSQRDMYEGIIEGFENVDDEISRGWLDDGTIEFLRLIKGETLSATATTKELKAAYKSLDDTIEHTSYSIRDFFTVDEDGNSTNAGVYNFLDAIGQMEEEKFGGKDVVQRDKNGNIIGFDFELVGGDEAIAEALGVSEELVQIMVRAADDAGFVISMDGTYQQLDVLKEKAEEAAIALKNTFKKTDYEFFQDGSEAGVAKDYAEALKIWETFKQNKNEDGTIDMSVEGAEEAYTLISTLQSMVDQLSEPVYMELDASQVEKDLRDPLSKLQEYERLTQEEHQLELKGTDTSEIEASKEEIINYFDELQENKPEIAAELGIEGLTREEIQAKVEDGEIEIPATIDLQIEMNDSIEELLLIAKHEAGLISDEELNLKVKYEVDDSLVDSWSEEEKKVAVELIVDNKEEFDKLTSEEKTVVVKYIAETEDLEGYTPEMKEAIVKYIVNDGEVGDWTPEEKLAFAKYLVDGGNVDGWTPEAKDAFVKYLVDGGDPDKFDPEDKNSWVVYDTNTTKPDSYTPSDENATVNYDVNDEKVKQFNPPNIFRKVIYTIKEFFGGDGDGEGGVDGTANVNGTTGRAFKQGSWGTKNSGVALMGELGTETIVRNGKFFTVGDNGAGFYPYKKGDIIFNHKQTEELFKNGKVTSGGGRGRALYSGTAFANGTAFSSGSGGIGKVNTVVVETNNTTVETKSSSSSSSSSSTGTRSSRGSSGSGGVGKTSKTSYAAGTAAKNSKSSSSSSSTKDDFEETFDWIEIAISRIEREIDNLDTKSNSTYRSWSERNKNLANEITKVSEEINLQQKAYNRYLKEADAVGLSSALAKKVREGTIDIQDITNESVADQVKEYQKW